MSLHKWVLLEKKPLFIPFRYIFLQAVIMVKDTREIAVEFVTTFAYPLKLVGVPVDRVERMMKMVFDLAASYVIVFSIFGSLFLYVLKAAKACREDIAQCGSARQSRSGGGRRQKPAGEDQLFRERMNMELYTYVCESIVFVGRLFVAWVLYCLCEMQVVMAWTPGTKPVWSVLLCMLFEACACVCIMWGPGFTEARSRMLLALAVVWGSVFCAGTPEAMDVLGVALGWAMDYYVHLYVLA